MHYEAYKWVLPSLLSWDGRFGRIGAEDRRRRVERRGEAHIKDVREEGPSWGVQGEVGAFRTS